jgi:uncharacterized protein (DUF1330 family)
MNNPRTGPMSAAVNEYPALTPPLTAVSMIWGRQISRLRYVRALWLCPPENLLTKNNLFSYTCQAQGIYFSQQYREHPMTTYLIANYRVTNPEAYAEYPPAVAPTLAPFGGELLVADFDSEIVEGAASPVSIVLRFPSRQSARDWYNSPEYQAVIHLRTDNSEGQLVFADSLPAPA